jgi:hypothetical protein
MAVETIRQQSAPRMIASANWPKDAEIHRLAGPASTIGYGDLRRDVQMADQR